MLTLGLMELQVPVEKTQVCLGKDNLWDIGGLIVTTTDVARVGSSLGWVVVGRLGRHLSGQ